MRTWMILAIGLVICSCHKDDTKPTINWFEFKTGLVYKDNTIIEKEISKLLINSYSKPTNDDLIGQKSNIDGLVNEINESNLLDAELFCYACIETYPGQSEILVIVDSLGFSVSRIIDILTPEDSILKFVNIHDAY